MRYLSLVLLSLCIAQASFAGTSTAEYRDSAPTSSVDRTLAIQITPLSMLDSSYSVATVFPIADMLLLGPKFTYMSDGGFTFRTGYQVGLRAEFLIDHSWMESGAILNAGVFYNHYEQSGDGCGGGTICFGQSNSYVSHGLAGDLMGGYQWVLLDRRLQLSAVGGAKLFQVDRIASTGETSLLYPTIELGVGLML